MDDWVLATYNIPSVTAELGNENDFLSEWTVKDNLTAFNICKDNFNFLEHTFMKLGNQIAFKPVAYKKNLNSSVIDVYINVTNEGLTNLVDW